MQEEEEEEEEEEYKQGKTQTTTINTRPSLWVLVLRMSDFKPTTLFELKY